MNKNFNVALFCKRLKEARANKKMTQKELSEKTGVSTVMISAYENDDISTGKNPALSNVYLLATALGVSIDWLCGLSDNSELQKNGINIDTEKFLYSITELVNNCPSCNVINKPYGDEYSITISNSLLTDFISDYSEVQSVIVKKLLPEEVEETVIKSIIDKYKDHSIKALFAYCGVNFDDVDVDNFEI